MLPRNNMAVNKFHLHHIDNEVNINNMDIYRKMLPVLLSVFLVLLSACGSHRLDVYHDPNFDFGAIRTVAVMPFENLSRENTAASRVRDVFMNMLQSSGTIYVLPPGEVARGLTRAGLDREKGTAPSQEEAVKLGGIVKADAVITGVVREYGEVHSGAATSNIVSISLQMIETQTGKIVWTASSTRGGITTGDRLFGGGGRPMNDVTHEAVIDVINKLF